MAMQVQRIGYFKMNVCIYTNIVIECCYQISVLNVWQIRMLWPTDPEDSETRILDL